MGSRRDCNWILGLRGFRVVTTECDETVAAGRLTIRIERRGVRRYPCSGCGRRTGWVRSSRDRTWDDLPWAHHHVTLVYPQRRVRCRRCGIRTERVEFADPKARITRRLRQVIGLDCQSMPTSHAAVRHGVSWSKARRAERAFLHDWNRARVHHRPCHLGLDEIQRGKGQKFWTLFDTGARNTYVVPKVAALLPTSQMSKTFRSALGGKVHDATQAAVLDADIQGCKISTHAMVLDEIGKDEDGKPIDVLFGALAMQQWGIRPVPDEEKLDMSHYSKEFLEF